MWPPFKTQVPGKWVLAGEHAILRGFPAVVLPHRQVWLEFEYQPGVQAREHLDYSEIQNLFQMGCDFTRTPLEFPEGTLTLESSIPSGAGLGSSAALCGAVARWMNQHLHLDHDKMIALATYLENRFHGKSSGMDVAVVLKNIPLFVERTEDGILQFEALQLKKMPHFTLHDSGIRSATRGTIEQVLGLSQRNSSRAQQLDEQMGQASLFARKGLENGNLGLIQESMRLSRQCFEEWGLIPGPMEALEQGLREKGALATKPTGAGGGGFVVALWTD